MLHKFVDCAEVNPIDRRPWVEIQPKPAVGVVQRDATAKPSLHELLSVPSRENRIFEAQVETIARQQFELGSLVGFSCDHSKYVDASDASKLFGSQHPVGFSETRNQTTKQVPVSGAWQRTWVV